MIGSIFSGITALGGLLGSANAQRQAAEARRNALIQLQQQNDQLYSNTLDANNRTLLQQAGTAGDAIDALGRRLGSSLANAGVYNSSATAGAVTQAQQNQDTALANLSANLRSDALRQKQQGNMQLGQLQLGQANQDYNTASSNLYSSIGGLSSFLGSLAQYNLGRSGANAHRGTRQKNGTVKQLTELPGNANGSLLQGSGMADDSTTYGNPLKELGIGGAFYLS